MDVKSIKKIVFDIIKKMEMKMILKRRLKSANIQASTFGCIRNNLTIRGTEYRPQGNNLPIAIVCHGFMAFQDTVGHYAVKLAEMGYLSYCFDFCGGSVIKGKSDGKTTEMSVYTEVEDLLAVIDYAKKHDKTAIKYLEEFISASRQFEN